MMSNISINYQAEPTLQAFHRSKANLRAVMGPIGSGKSVGCVMELFTQGLRMPACKDGVRRSRYGVARNTFPELTSTTINTIMDWFPEQITTIKYTAPIMIHVRVPNLGDGTSLDMELVCLALDRPADVKKLLSLELTGFWGNECRELDKSIIDAALGRIGRYPSKNMLGGQMYHKFVILDTNPPDDSHWLYQIFEEQEVPDGWEIYYQPPSINYDKALSKYVPNPEAENVGNHTFGYEYWLDQVAGKTTQWIEVYLRGRYGSSVAGKPVYETSWNDDIHVSEGILEPITGREIVLGWDFGLDPSVVILQITASGQVRILDEFTKHGSGIKQFYETTVKPVLVSKYRGCPIVSIGDPTFNQRAQTDEQSVQGMMASLGIPTDPCSTNDPRMRIESVSYFLNQLADGKPRFLLSKHCKFLRKGFNGGYRYRKLNVSGETRYTDKPEKNLSSHIHDALQYAMVYLKDDIDMRELEYQGSYNVQEYSTAGIAGY